MERISHHCAWADSQIKSNGSTTTDIFQLPSELRAQISQSLSNTSKRQQYLNALASQARETAAVDGVFALYESVYPDLVVRWIYEGCASLEGCVKTLSALGKVLPFAGWARTVVSEVLGKTDLNALLKRLTTSQTNGTRPENDVEEGDLTTEQLSILLVAIFRLLSFDRDEFDRSFEPAFFTALLSHDSRVIRTLAVECLVLVMHLSDAYREKLVQTYVGDEAVLGSWEDVTIDYRLFKIWEKQRWKKLAKTIKACRDLRGSYQINEVIRDVGRDDLHPNTALIGQVMLPRNGPLRNTQSSFADTTTSMSNLSVLGHGLTQSKPILLAGPAGSGKTSLIMEAARTLNRQESLITLYLNEQTDAKSLIGLYTSSANDGSFVWQPGVLTKALQEGRWVLIEDIDRAPAEVLGVLRPLIENGALFIPNRRQHVKAADGFRILATIRTATDNPTAISNRHGWLTSKRLWSVVAAQAYPTEEIADIICQRYPELRPISHTIFTTYEKLALLYRVDPAFKTAQGRTPAIRDLLKWCRRLSRRVHDLDLVLDGTRAIPETFTIDCFKDALSCHASHLSDTFLYNKVAEVIAEVLDIAPNQRDFHLTPAEKFITESTTSVTIGRSALPKLPARKSAVRRKPFASTTSSRRGLESIAASVASSEPCLLVGETGVGKTSLVQHIVSTVGQTLTVVNLSQQSEVSDLLGGLKPVTTLSLMMPVMEAFKPLFDDTFSASKNEKFLTAVDRAFEKGNWARLLKSWQQALQMADKAFNSSKLEVPNGPVAKKRKIDTPRSEQKRERWLNFATEVKKLQSQVDRGDKTQTFTFVEGRLVKAVRNGEWLLLDEINLASSDTLDHIASLLANEDGQRPSILLAEAGSIEKVVAHPNFRVFAAMNPATDAGKKDLPPALRSHFTEIYVHSGDDNTEDLVRIVQSYLGQILNSDKRAALDLARTYLEVQQLTVQHRLTDGAGDAPHFSVRSLVRCLEYVTQHSTSHGLRRSMYEGFAMSFFTSLSRESEVLCSPIIEKHLLSSMKNLKSFLSQQPKMSGVEGFVAFRHHLIRRGQVAIDLQPHYIRTASVERNLMNLARAASMGRFPILLQGPTSAGKTSMVEYLAKLTGNKFIRINNHEHTDLQEYLGSYGSDSDGKLQFREGVLVDALRHGHWIVLDELNLAPSDVLEALNRLLDDNRELLIPETQEIIKPHPSFMLFATQNPAGLYGGRKRFSRAFRNRFLEIHFDDIPEDELEIILRERAQIAPSFCTQIVAVYKKLSLLRQSSRLFEQRNSFATLRDLFRWASRKVDDRQQLARHGFMLLAERVREPSEREMVKTTIEETMKVKLDESLLYGEDRLPVSVKQTEGIVWTSAMRRLYVLVSEALKNNEPVLLVGETGCGKTQICQVVAAAFGRKLNIYNAHTNTETGDLIGSQRPVRSRAQLALDVVESVKPLLDNAMTNGTTHEDDPNVEDLINQFFALDAKLLEVESVAKAQSAIAAYRSLFVWSDGALVRAMRVGEHFLLDEVSLADDSVLERLNSVLEPGRTIVLAEKGAVDNLVVAQPEFQFVSTMNPGGDYGKRELSAALRNRLTEIWVPPLSNENDVLPIVEATLRDEARYLASSMLGFAAWFKTTIHGAMNSSIPLRDLLTWAKFINTQTELSVELAFVHGAGLVFIDSVGANPAGMTGSTVVSIADARRQCREKLQQLVSVDVHELYNTRPELSASEDFIGVGLFKLPRALDAEPIATDLVFDAPTTLKNTMRIVRALQLDRPVLLEGNPGVGKTAIVTALAQAVGKPFTRINLSDQTDLMDLFGADAPTENESLGNFAWQDGPLLKAMQNGGWVLLDEMNLASQSVLEGLNSCLDHRKEAYIAELDKTFSCHPEFRLFAAQNPHHQGSGRKGLPASFVNRFTVVYADPFEKEDLMRICQAKYPGVNQEQLTTIVQVVSETDHHLQHQPGFQHGGPWEVNLRDVSRWLALSQSQPALNQMYHFDTILTSRFRDAKQKDLLSSIREHNIGNTPPVSTYSRLTHDNLNIGIATLSRSAIQQYVAAKHDLLPKLLPAAASIITAVQYGWPVIVSGPADSGKTELIRTLAAVSGAKLVDISMNADVDTMDLLGGFEQYDPTRSLEQIGREVSAVLLAKILEGLAGSQVSSKLVPSELVPLLAAWQLSQSSTRTAVSLSAVLAGLETVAGLSDFLIRLRQLIDENAGRRTQFVWNDGVLIDAIQEGAWVVLDNANLCNASVLDRLNSLLEADGHLVISEQHSNNGADTRIVRPHPNFRIFLTVDPKYGELSRAMRNRSLEVFLPDSVSLDGSIGIVEYQPCASMSRLDELASEEESSAELASIYGDNMAIKDLVLLKSTGQTQVVSPFSGLTPVLSTWLSQAEATSTALQRMLPHSSRVITEHPHQNHGPTFQLLNEPSLLAMVQESGVASFRPSLQSWQLQQLVTTIELRLQTALNRSKTLAIQELSTFERSALSIKNKKVNANTTPAIYSFVRANVEQIMPFVSSMSRDDVSNANFATAIVQFLSDMLQLAHGTNIDMARFQAFLQIGPQLLHLTESQSALPTAFTQNLELFNMTRLSYGQGLQTMWQTWSPKVPQTIQELDEKLALETLLDRFERAATSLPQQRTALAQVKMRLLDAAASAWQSPEAGLVAEQLSLSIDGLERQLAESRELPVHFDSTFLHLFHRVSMQNKTTGSEMSLDLVPFVNGKHILQSRHATSESISASLGRLSSLRSNYDDSGRRMVDCTLSGLSSTPLQPLRGLQSVKAEIKQILRTVSSQSRTLGQSILEVVQNRTEALLLAVLRSHVHLLPEQLRAANYQGDLPALANSLTLLLKNQSGSMQKIWFDQILKQYLLPSLETLGSRAGNQLQTEPQIVGKALMQVSAAALAMMVPDKPFDPALLPQIEAERHEARRSELTSKIEAQREFDVRISGQTSSLVGRLLQRDLENLGTIEPPVTVVRPQQSTLVRVQEDFTMIIRGVLQSETVTNLKESHDNDEASLSQLQDTISRVLDRLRKLDRAYDDMVIPVSQLLSCLGLGIDVIQDSASTALAIAKAVQHSPLMGAQPSEINQWPLQGLKKNDRDRLAWLHHYSLKISLQAQNKQQTYRQASTSGDLKDYLTIIDSFYMHWKERLAKDQREAEANSRYYAYRGDEEEDPDAESREMAELFPTYDDNTNDGLPDKKEAASSKMTVFSKVAEVHQCVFGDQHSNANLTTYLSRVVKEHSYNSQDTRLSFQNALPGLILQLDDQIQTLEHRDQTKPFNIYTDSHVQEIENLQQLVHNIRARFAEIHEQWPEHAVPIDARLACDNLLDFPLGTPLAELLTKTEKLLEIIAQWQSVASREWSVANLLEQTTALIVSWRRLELSSWSRLLDFEKQKHDAGAASWFFIAYEAVLYNSRVVVDSEGDVRAYCKELVKTLEEFFKNSTLGQFGPRLQLLRSLSAALSDMSLEDERVQVIAGSVAHVIGHYGRYTTNIDKKLSTGRAELEKAVIEQIKLASWKDTNVTALKDSARRSHHKLFKIVRKYRALMNQPISDFKAEEKKESADEQEVRLLEASSSHVQPAQKSCAENISDWQTRPQRLTDPSTAVAGMRRVYLAQQGEIDVQVELESFRTDLTKSIQDLRKETPSSLTKDNTAMVKHLRERKRRLLADTIKDVAFMGLRRNLAMVDMEKQANTTTVLSDMVQLRDLSVSQEVGNAQQALHDLLDDMPSARTALAQHSHDLTDGEVQRGLGLLEGLLFQGLAQRESLVGLANGVSELKNTLSMLPTLHTSGDIFHMSASSEGDHDAMEVRLQWLPSFLDTSVHVLDIQAQYGGLDLSDLSTCLKTAAEEIRGLKTTHSNIGQTPAGLVTREAIELEQGVWAMFRTLEQELLVHQTKEPNIEYLVVQILPWLLPDTASAERPLKPNGINHLALNSIDQALRELVDSVFVALQQLSSVKTPAIADTEDAGWLLRNDKHFSECARALHVAEINDKLVSILANLQHLRPEHLSIAASLLTVAGPVLSQFALFAEHCVGRQAAVHNQTLRLASFLTKSFTIVANEGFCTPPDPSDGQEQTGKLESGTGLGDGEGAEDISKDVGADEDLSEFAQQEGEKQDEDGEMEDAEGAVDMGADDLQGQMGDSGKKDEDGDGDDGSDAESADMGEETGSVDDLDPTAVDEKMWDEAQKEGEEDEKELKGEKQKGEKTKEQTEAGGEKAEGENEGEVDDAEGVDEGIDNDDDENVGEGKAEAEHADPHLQDEQALDLPEELQFNGEDEGKSDAEDDGMGDLSDVDQPDDAAKEEVDSVGDPDHEEDKPADANEEINTEDDDAEGAADDDEIMPDQPPEPDNEDQDHAQRDGDMDLDADDHADGEQGAANQLQDNIDPDQVGEGQNQIEQASDENKKPPQAPAASDNKDQGDEGGKGVAERSTTGRDDQKMDRKQTEALRKLADVLEQWHQRREIFDPAQEQDVAKPEQDVDMNDADFEHLDEDDEEADAQALGAAGVEQTQNVDMSKAILDEDVAMDDQDVMPEAQEKESEEVQATERLNRLQASGVNEATERREDGAFVPDKYQESEDDEPASSDEQEIDIDDTESLMASEVQQLDLNNPTFSTSLETATQLWTLLSQRTHTASLTLTEQLRLILHPTTATKLRGDFHSGKRLNLKRIIPYIASGYKRDKIWMRRSVPSKRQYQILLAIDDSKSMSESGADLLALETTALLVRSLAMLEVGEVGVLGFGKADKSTGDDEGGVKVAHELGDVWKGQESGVKVFQTLGFRQEGTDFAPLIRRALAMLGEARARKMGVGANEELWQLMIIVSDGLCSQYEYEKVKSLVRQGKEERVLIVFVVLDNVYVNKDEVLATAVTGSSATAAATTSGNTTAQPQQGREQEQQKQQSSTSILDLKIAEFEKQPDGEEKVVLRRYLERFPFEYYLVVRDVKELPGVLGRCLRGWFGEVSGI